jgi:hypothetical protein
MEYNAQDLMKAIVNEEQQGSYKKAVANFYASRDY